MESFTTFGLSRPIQNALDGLNYKQPTEVQQKVIPKALHGKDLVVKSQTGSGKTAAFGIPLCELVEWEENKPQVLILTPTRELAAQVKEDITNIGRFKRIKATALYGKQPFHRQKEELKQKSHFVVGTPGRVLDHIEKGTFPLEKLDYLVLDEADEMLNMGFISQVEAILAELPEKRVNFLFSATMTEEVERLSERLTNGPVRIEITPDDVTTNTIYHSVIEVEEKAKFSLLKDITVVENPDSCMIFCRTKERVDTVHQDLLNARYPVEKLHGGLTQEERFRVMKSFKRGEFRYLVATDVAARGIDVERVTHVINYDLPMEKEAYVHRTGRTGRAGQTGQAITFVTPYEDKFLKEIEAYIGFTLPDAVAPSKGAVSSNLPRFNKTLQSTPKVKEEKGKKIDSNIMKLYFNGGKKKKIRAVDFVGTISNIKGVTADDIGIITIEENISYVEILNGKGPTVLNAMKSKTIKGKQLKVHEARK
ncbi:RNA helicase [Pontibacillus halophilus JSM 076056 = DSM 19796]|uniref:ATP-dependent RNA helicase DbpA n=1 Tax=Pontibacillus halophilus JSM 076056 = DSM 19796 TaxID=1385510 RepID=A0A0A5GP81_9BACI|nr:DEAD/DEAH box helicase [Pontibacillus halophilus]KGX93023.1 RNA helicase [Pontibacillus halophilus JSM 076056 = DSM 19796]